MIQNIIDGNFKQFQLFIHNKEPRDFFGFCLRQGFRYGFIDHSMQYVWNGYIYSDGSISVYFSTTLDAEAAEREEFYELNNGPRYQWVLYNIYPSDSLYAMIMCHEAKNKRRVLRADYSSDTLSTYKENSRRDSFGCLREFYAQKPNRKADVKIRHKQILQKQHNISNANKSIYNPLDAKGISVN